MKDRFSQHKVVWFAFFSAPFLYLLILRVMFSDTGSDTSTNNNVNLMLFYYPAAASVLGGFMIPKLLLKSVKEITKQKLFMAMIIRMAIFESVAMIGFVAGIMTKNANEYYPFLFVAALCMIQTIPTPTKWEQNKL